jgi:16S rRNA (cytosine967-C5)-methyltransferase
VIAPARVAAYETLRAVESGRADLPSALARARSRLDDERDRALAGEIAVGTLRWQGAFDAIVEAFSGRAIARLDDEILTVLRLSMFQLLHLDRVPAAAVVDDGVELARKAGKRSAAGFVNAMLRRVSRERKRLPLPAAPGSDADRTAILNYLSTTLSHPRWLVSRWLDRYGYDAVERWAQFDNAPAPLTLRTNTLRTSKGALQQALADAGVGTRDARYARDALIVTDGNPLLTPLAHHGRFVVQDEASQLVGEFVGARAGERILDACASPGGKTTQMAAAMHDRGLIVAADVRGKRIDLLSRTVADSGATTIRIVQTDARDAMPFHHHPFDAVLLDAPCSGLGTIRRDPDVRWRRTESDLPALADAQLRMLTQASTVIRPRGRLIYATCSSEPEENDQVVQAFCAANPEFVIEPPAELGEALRVVIESSGFLRTLPFAHGLEAFFAARLVRTQNVR